MSAMYAVYHGPEGLKRIAERVHGLAGALAVGYCTWIVNTSVMQKYIERKEHTERSQIVLSIKLEEGKKEIG